MRFFRRRDGKRPFLASLADLAVLLILLLLAALALREAGWLEPERGSFAAIDGDSLRKGEEEFRLHGIDAPELRQVCRDESGREYACGREARAALVSLIAGKRLDCTIIDRDRYGRSVAICRAGSVDINGAMVDQGHAIAYRRHGSAYTGEEASARRAKRGIWRGPFEDPEIWRERQRLVSGTMAED